MGDWEGPQSRSLDPLILAPPPAACLGHLYNEQVSPTSQAASCQTLGLCVCPFPCHSGGGFGRVGTWFVSKLLKMGPLSARHRGSGLVGCRWAVGFGLQGAGVSPTEGLIIPCP